MGVRVVFVPGPGSAATACDKKHAQGTERSQDARSSQSLGYVTAFGCPPKSQCLGPHLGLAGVRDSRWQMPIWKPTFHDHDDVNLYIL